MRANSEIIFSNTTQAPPAIPPRGLSRTQAAAYVGLSPSAFDAARRAGIYPNPTLPGGRYDRQLLDEVMSRLSGIALKSEGVSALDWWRAAR
jgi:hypothetical protein